VQVFKFGGAAVKDPAAIRNVALILQNYASETLLIVVSAMGKTTNALEKIVEAHATQTGEAPALLEALKNTHYQAMGELFPADHDIFDQVNDTFVEIEWVLDEDPHDNYDYMYDQIVSVGELVSSKIVGAFLTQEGLPTQWLDARDVVQTNELYREAWVNWPETEARFQKNAAPMLVKQGFVITQGFIGSTIENFTTTLGRDGSDYSAAIFSFCAQAQGMTIWKDAPGVFSADPRFFPGAAMLEKMSYEEAIAMTYYGAKIIHLKTVGPLQDRKIPLRVKSFLEPSGEGTLISAENPDSYPALVAVEANQALLKISNLDYSFVNEQHLELVFKTISDLRMQLTFLQNTPMHFLVSVFDQENKVNQFVEQVQSSLKVEVTTGLELLNVRHGDEATIAELCKNRSVHAVLNAGKTTQLLTQLNG
jgi:aspartate kinase